MSNPLFIVDTNVLVSSVVFRNSTPSNALKKALTEGVLVFTQETMDEFREVVLRPKFDAYVTRQKRQAFYGEMVSSALKVKTKPCNIKCRDPKDQKFLEALTDEKIDYLITGDQDLLVLKQINSCQIITPAEFLKQKL